MKYGGSQVLKYIFFIGSIAIIIGMFATGWTDFIGLGAITIPVCVALISGFLIIKERSGRRLRR